MVGRVVAGAGEIGENVVRAAFTVVFCAVMFVALIGVAQLTLWVMQASGWNCFAAEQGHAAGLRSDPHTDGDMRCAR